MKKFIALCAGVLFATAPLFAVPARPVSAQIVQPDGTVITIRIEGDEFCHYRVTDDGIPVVRGEDGFFRYAEISSRGIAVAGKVIARDADARTVADKAYLASLAEQQVSKQLVQRVSPRKQEFQRRLKNAQSKSATGEVHGLVLLVQFKDKKFSSVGTQEAFDEMMNKEGYDYNGTLGSARDYFIDQSYGQFQPIFDVVGPVTLDNNLAYYGENDAYGNDIRSREMIVEACQKAEDMVDFSIYDRDNDGVIDLVYVIYAGYSEAEDTKGLLDDTIWPHAWSVYSSVGGMVAMVDGIQIDDYACSAELEGESGTVRNGIGAFCHEYSHTLGLKDYYDTAGGGNYGMGTWSLMDTGCYNGENFNGTIPAGYSAYDRASCGWITLQELTEPASISFENTADSRIAYKITSSDPNQYFTLENRQQTRWDSLLAASGLMITKVDYDKDVWFMNEVNNDGTRPRMALIPADNNSARATEKNDLYPYKTKNAFTLTSRPSSVIYRTEVDKPVTNIAHKNGVITFDFMGGDTGIDELNQTQNCVWVEENQVVVKSEQLQQVVIVNVAGQVVASTTAEGVTRLTVPTSGIYLVRSGASVTRVAVK